MGHTKTLAKTIDIIMTSTQVRLLVVSDIINLVLVDELFIDDPRRFRENLVYPSAVANSLNSGK